MAEVTYEDDFGAGKMAMGVVDYTVRGIPSPDNAPEFDDVITDREVMENTSKGMGVGSTVKATHEDGHILTYTINSENALTATRKCPVHH